MTNHGESTETFRYSDQFTDDWDSLVEKHSQLKVTGKGSSEIVADERVCDFDEQADELEQDYLKNLGEEYLRKLQREYEYMYTEEYAKDTCEANEYEFDENGKIQ